MDNYVKQRLEEIKQQGFKVETGALFSRAWEIFSGIAAYSIVALLLYGVVVLIMSFVSQLIYAPAAVAISDVNDLEDYYIETFTAPLFFVSNLVSIVVYAAVAPILFSIVTMARKFEKSETVGMNDIFEHYSNGNFMNIFLTYLVIQIVASIGFVLCLIPGLVFQLATVLSVPFVLFAKATVGEAITSSISVSFKNFGSIFVFGLLTFCVIVLGFLACVVGLVVAIPLVYIALYCLYKEVIGFDDEQSEIDQIGTDIYKDNPYMK